jgi:hypothetical protein
MTPVVKIQYITSIYRNASDPPFPAIFVKLLRVNPEIKEASNPKLEHNYNYRIK